MITECVVILLQCALPAGSPSQVVLRDEEEGLSLL
jgi:hypothetical protein